MSVKVFPDCLLDERFVEIVGVLINLSVLCDWSLVNGVIDGDDPIELVSDWLSIGMNRILSSNQTV